ncbi:MAG: PilZ domain-containing protein [Candidatus Acidiferrales bacterium]
MAEEKAPEYSTRRRSERLYLTIPIRVSGTDPRGRDFTEDCVSVDVSRHGSRIRLIHPLTVDDVIRIQNLKNGLVASFRVIGRVGEPNPDVAYADWGVDGVDPAVTIWGVELKDNPTEDIASSALLRCSACLVVSSFLLTYTELGAVAASSFITRACPRCQRETLWSFVSSDRRASPVAEMRKSVMEQIEEERRAQDRRQETRLTVEVPIRIRSTYGEEEVTKTVNLSRKGARFTSAKEYAVGSMVFVAAPYREGQDPIEVKGTIAHVEELSGSPKRLVGVKLYEVRFETKDSKG